MSQQMGIARGTYRYTPLSQHPDALWHYSRLKQLLKNFKIWHVDCSLYNVSSVFVEVKNGRRWIQPKNVTEITVLGLWGLVELDCSAKVSFQLGCVALAFPVLGGHGKCACWHPPQIFHGYCHVGLATVQKQPS